METQWFLGCFIYFGHHNIKRNIFLMQTIDKIEINMLWWNISIDEDKDSFQLFSSDKIIMSNFYPKVPIFLPCLGISIPRQIDKISIIIHQEISNQFCFTRGDWRFRKFTMIGKGIDKWGLTDIWSSNHSKFRKICLRTFTKFWCTFDKVSSTNKHRINKKINLTKE